MGSVQVDAMSSGLSNAEISELREVFTLLDVHQKGMISASDLTSVLTEIQQENINNNSNDYTASSNSKLRHPLTKLLETLHRLPPDKSLTFNEFVALAVNPDPNDTRDDLQKAFDLFDRDGKGFVDVKDLRAVSHSLGEQMTDDELHEMINRATSTAGGKVTYAEFASMMNKKLFS